MLISPVGRQKKGRQGGREEGRGKEERNAVVWTLLQSHDDEAIKVNSSWQTQTINKLTLHRTKCGLSCDNESFYSVCDYL